MKYLIWKNNLGQSNENYVGEKGIRTLGSIATTHAFQACWLGKNEKIIKRIYNLILILNVDSVSYMCLTFYMVFGCYFL